MFTGFKRPGTFHHARWMAKAVYAMNNFIFRGEFPLTRTEEVGLREIVMFIVTLYARAWFSAAEAAVNDLRFLLTAYCKVNGKLADAALKSFKRHLWYQSPDLVGFSLFSRNLSVAEKTNVVANMAVEKESPNRKRWEAGDDTTACTSASCAVQSRGFIDALHADDGFLALPWTNGMVTRATKKEGD
jgi:hypothetical protein